MKEYKVNSGYGWHAWFWVDKEEFEGEWKIGTLRYRVEKAVGRADDGKLFSFALSDEGLDMLNRASEQYVKQRFEKEFKTLQFYKTIC